jgi:alkylation response protein AidB-like acyl-CoA dehydrogenase
VTGEATDSDRPLIPRREMAFLLYEWLGLEALLLQQPRFGHLGREDIDAVLELSERVARETFLPHYKEADQIEPVLSARGVDVLPAIGSALRNYRDLGLFAAGFSETLGGAGLPHLVTAASFAQFAAANIATAAYPMLTVANARLIATFGSAAQIEHFAVPQIQGRWFGTMCLSEPQAGSSLADVRTRAELDGVDSLGARYRLSGHKMWISGGDQDVSDNIVHLVLARIAARDEVPTVGSRTLSLFIVPKILPDGSRNDVAVAGLNHKMGYRGTANCLLNFGEQGGAIGWRVGESGAGLRQMFQMMNEARIGVGIGAAALAYRGYRQALRYARERLQGRAAGIRDGAPVAIINHPDVKRLLLTQKSWAEGALALCLYCAKLVDAADCDAAVLLALLTPVAKTWSAEYGCATNDLAIQIHGGYGYARDFDVEQLYRDNRLNPIHEGTSAIQAIDLLGRKILGDRGAGLSALEKRITACCLRAAAEPSLVRLADRLKQAWSRLTATVAGLLDHSGSAVLDDASVFLAAFGHVVVAWLWLEQAVVARRLSAGRVSEPDFLAGKLRACEFFFECELPRIEVWLSIVDSRSETASAMPSAQF